MEFLAQLFFPHPSNNFKAKLLGYPVVLFFTGLLFFTFVARVPTRLSQVLGYTASLLPADKIIELTNQKRVENGLPELKFDPNLAAAAAKKGADMLSRDYWAHFAPDGTTPWSFFLSGGYKYVYAGENLARDFDSPSDVVNAWMASPTHRENLLSGKYDDIGIAVVEGDLAGQPTTIVVQFFGKRINAAAAAGAEIGTTATAVAPSPVPALSIVAGNINLSPFEIKRNFAVSLISLFIVLLIIDMVFLWNLKVIRVSSRSFAHFGLMVSIGILILTLGKGSIL